MAIKTISPKTKPTAPTIERVNSILNQLRRKTKTPDWKIEKIGVNRVGR